jgi:hypothetical protein
MAAFGVPPNRCWRLALDLPNPAFLDDAGISQGRLPEVALRNRTRPIAEISDRPVNWYSLPIPEERRERRTPLLLIQDGQNAVSTNGSVGISQSSKICQPNAASGQFPQASFSQLTLCVPIA